MSAFIVSDDHIHALVSYALGGANDRISTRHDNDQLGQVLVNENYRSVNYRYRAKDEPPRYSWRPTLRPFKPVEILKACDCYDYQSCETEDYDSTEAARIIQQIRSKAIRNLPGYESAAWDIRDEPTGISLSSLVK